jgi:hypothetical protein
MVKRVIFLAFFVTCRIWPQTAFGTLVAVYATNDEVAVAADSRAILGGREVDNTCKIAVLGKKLIIALAGKKGYMLTADKWDWDTTAIAHATFQEMPAVEQAGGQFARKFSMAWGSAVSAQFTRDLQIRRKETLEFLPNNVLANGLVIGREPSGSLAIYTIRFTYTSKGEHFVATYEVGPRLTPVTLALGTADIFNEVVFDQSERGRKWHRELS